MRAALLINVFVMFELFELLHHGWELQFGFRQGLYDQAFGVFRGQVARGGHFAD